MNAKLIEESISSDSDVPLGFSGYNQMPEYLKDSLLKYRRPEFSTISQNTKKFISKHFPGVSDEQWNSWKWQIKNSYTTFDQLNQIIDLKRVIDEELIVEYQKVPLRITPYYASLLEGTDANNPIVKGVVPSIYEVHSSPGEASDPLNEENCSPVPNIVHRYPDRVMFLATGFCSTYCRYCTRSHMVATDKMHYGKAAWQPGLEYIRNNKNILYCRRNNRDD